MNSQTNPLLQREISSHHPVTSIGAILGLMRLAEQGHLVTQAELFNDMEELDAHIFAEMFKRKSAVAELDWSLGAHKDAGAKEAKAIAALEELIEENIDVSTLLFDIADGIGHGFACLELEWQRLATGVWFPGKITHRPQRWFTVDRDTRTDIRLRSATVSDGEILRPNSWIVHRHSSKQGGPATQGLFRALVMPYIFKNFAIKNWLSFCERYGKAFLAMIHHETDPVVRAELLDALQSMGANGAALLYGGNGDDLKAIDTTKGEGAGFMALIDWCERSVSKAILGGTLTSDTGKNGNYATAQVHDGVRTQIRDHDARQIAVTLTQQLIGAIVKVNGWAIRPRWAFDTQEPEDLTLYADALPKLAAVGAQIPVSWAHDKLKIPMPVDGEAVLGAPAPASPNDAAASPKDAKPDNSFHACGGVNLAAGAKFTPEQQAIEDLADGVVNALKSPIPASVIASAIRGARDPQDLETRLAAIMRDQSLDTFTTVLERALFAADVMGYAHAGETAEPAKLAAAAAAPAINITAPITVTMPEQKAPVVNFAAPEPIVVNVTVPEQPAPVVNVTATPGDTVVNFQAPEQPAPVVNVTATPAMPTTAVQTVERDADGEIIKTITEYN